MGKNQVRFAVMYHSVTIRAALRVINGAKQTKDICQVSPDYEYTESSSLFICTQDLQQLNESLRPDFNESLGPDFVESLEPEFNESVVPHEHQQRGFFRCIFRGAAHIVHSIFCLHCCFGRSCTFYYKQSSYIISYFFRRIIISLLRCCSRWTTSYILFLLFSHDLRICYFKFYYKIHYSFLT